jgi:outer membrane protein OmpA-like peptidoglycan-associated protein
MVIDCAVIGLDCARSEKPTSILRNGRHSNLQKGDDMPSRPLFLVAGAALLLGACDQPQTQAAMAPPPLQQAQPANTTFVVLFDTGRSALSGGATSTVQQAAAAYRSRGSGTVAVTGHTDTVGSPGYNEALSQRRANAVKAGLINAGVPAEAITTNATGESALPVPTADNVSEQQNRSVMVDLGQMTTSSAGMTDAQYCQILARKVRADAYGTVPTGDLGKALSDCQNGVGNYGIPYMEQYFVDNKIPLPARA